MQIQLEDQMVTLYVQYAKRKKLSVTVDGSDLITVKAPKGTSEEAILGAVASLGPKIMEKLRSNAAARQVPRVKAYEGDEEAFLYLGKEYALHELIGDRQADAEELKLALKKFYTASLKNHRRAHQALPDAAQSEAEEYGDCGVADQMGELQL